MNAISTASDSFDNLHALVGGSWPLWIPLAFFGLHLVVIFLLAVAVKNDAEMLSTTRSGVFLIGPWFWFVIVLLAGGYLPTLAYWLIHYSSLRHRRENG